MLDEIGFKGNTAYFPEIDTLVLSDLHIGIEDAAVDEGMSMPLREAETLKRRLGNVLDFFEPSTVVFNGDVLHRFGEVGTSGKTLRDLRETVVDAGAESVFIKGNHDPMLDSLVETRDTYQDGNVVFVHGHTVPVDLPESPLYVVGHDHPAIEIEMQKRECFIYGPFEDSDVLMTPAFNPLCQGVVINRMSARDFMSPFIRADLDEFRVVVENEDGEVLRFPPLKEFRNML
ncbi:MAG: metallophosphoesterase [Halobacteria archaeon]|nr:metallophosphoesterase [Halobacteria archaeon]